MRDQNSEQVYTGLEIAVIGLDCKFPQAADAGQFWTNLKYGVEGIQFFSDEEMIQSGVDSALCKDPNYVKARGVLEDIEYFDASFFDYTPLEATVLDPQVRIFHECVMNALDNAGYNPDTYKGQIGLYAGSTENANWQLRQLLAGEHPTFNMSFREYLCTSISYKLRLKGPSVTVLSACSTSLVAVHLASQALLNGECNIALAGGVHLSLPSKKGYYYVDDLIYSADGHCRTFDSASQGTVISDGAGVVVLKTLQDAIHDRDHIYAVIKGSAINNDGNRKAGFSAPSINGQKEVIEAALQMAEVEAESITMVEAHGTGTKIGDSIEIEALKRAYGTNHKAYCAIGSVKSNIGHLNEAAGIAGLIKTILAIEHRQIPPTIHFNNPNPKIEFEDTPFYVNNALTDWTAADNVLRAAVSSFGIGGTNAHIILEAPPQLEQEIVEQAPRLFVFSAKTPTAVREQIRRFKEHLKSSPNLSLSDASYTLQAGRKTLPHRACIAAESHQELASKLEDKTVAIQSVDKSEYAVLYVLPDIDGDEQVVQQAISLYAGHPAFRQAADTAMRKLGAYGGIDFRTLFLQGNKNQPQREAIHFLFGYAVVTLMLRCNHTPLGLLGIKRGSCVAAAAAEAVALEHSFTAFMERGSTAITENPINNPSVPIFSAASGDKLLPGQLKEPHFWSDTWNSSFSATPGIMSLVNSPKTLVAYIGTEVNELVKTLDESKVISLVPHVGTTRGDRDFLEWIGRLWSAGLGIRWEALEKAENRGRIPLPAYPFERNRYFLDEDPVQLGASLLQQVKGQSGQQKSAMDCCYAPTWKKAAFSSMRSRKGSKPSAIIIHDIVLEERTIEICKRYFDHPVFVAKACKPVSAGGSEIQLENSSKSAYCQMLQAYHKQTKAFPRNILYFALSGHGMEAWDDRQGELLLQETYYGLLPLVQAIGECNANGMLQLGVVTNHLFDVLGNEEINPWNATLLGLVRGIPLEFPNLRCQLLEIGDQEQLRLPTVADILFREAESGQDEIAAIRGNSKWLPMYEPLAPGQDAMPVLSDQGVYLITGGSGGIGMELAGYLSRHCQASLVLIVRSAFPAKHQWTSWLREHAGNDPISEKIRRIQAMEQSGTQVYVYQSDVSDFRHIAQTIRQVQQEIGPIQGVIHAAGLPGSGFIEQQSKETADPVILTKALGCIHLNQILQDQPLDFFVVCSSISTLFPIIGQSDYNAANAFVDAYTDYWNRLGKHRITSIKWDVWKNVGMAVNTGMAPAPLKELAHPLLDSYVRMNDKDVFHSKLSLRKHWVLQDHRTEEYGVLSGTAVLEMVREAVESSSLKKPFLLRNIQFHTPILVHTEEEKEIVLILTKNNEFTVYGRLPEEHSWVPHVTGRIGSAEPQGSTVELEQLKERCTQQNVIYTEADNHKHAGHLIFGTRWRNIRQVMAGTNEGLALIELPEEYHRDLETYHLHPGLLDSATSFLLGFINRTSLYIPLSYESLIVYGELTSRVYSYSKYLDSPVAQEELASFDIQIMDEQGKLIMDIRNYTMVAVSDALANRISTNHGKPQHTALNIDHLLAPFLAGPAAVSTGILPEEGQEIFGRALAGEAATIIVSAEPLETRLRGNKSTDQLGKHGQQPATRKLQGKRPELPVAYAPAVTDIENKLCAIYENHLGFQPVGIEDDFFELGGDSLKAIHVISSIRKQFDCSLALTDFFQNKTIQSVARFIQQASRVNEWKIAPVDPKSHYPTSLAQKRIFFLQGLMPDTVGYNESICVLLEGSLSARKIEEIFATIIGRHESLRTSFRVEDGEIVQIIHPQVDFTLMVTVVNEDGIEQAVDRFIQPFDLAQAPLIRVGLLQAGEQRHLLVVDMHHIISDGTSINLLVKDFADLYMGKILPPLAIQYKDYAEWEQGFITTPAYQAKKAYWLGKLAGPLPVLTLPTDYPRPSSLSFQGGLITLELGRPLSERIKKFSQEQQVTWFMTMLAAYYALLARLSGESDILVGIPQAGRNHEDVHEMVGMFVNSLVLRNQPEREKPFLVFLQEVRASLLEALENQDFQIEMIVDQLNYKRDPSRNLLYDTIFNYQSMKNQTETEVSYLHDIKLSPYPMTSTTAKADLNIHLYEVSSGIYLECFYRTDLFKQETVQYIFEEYRRLIEAIPQQAGTAIGELPVFRRKDIPLAGGSVSPSANLQSFHSNDPAEGLVQRFEAQAAAYPAHIAVKYREESLNYRQLNEQANRIARRIRELTGEGIGERPVALLFGNTIEMVAALAGAIKAGVPFVPLDRSAPLQRLIHMVNDAQTALILSDSENVSIAHELAERVNTGLTIVNTAEGLSGISAENCCVYPDGNQTAFILYTSGSSGIPKGVVQSYRNITYYIARFTDSLAVNHEDRIALLTTYSHAIGILDILASLLNGATLHLSDLKLDASIQRFSRWLNSEGITLYHSVPSVFRFLMKNLPEDVKLPSLRMILLGGEVVTRADFELYKKNCAEHCLFVNFLGCSELMVISFYILDKQSEVNHAKLPAGYAVDGIEVRIVDDTGKEAGCFEVGQLLYQSEYLSPGYWNQAEATERAFAYGPDTGRKRLYRSGDYGRLLQNGCLEYHGRNDAQLKIRGYRVDLNEIESTLDHIPFIQQSMVAAVMDHEGEPAIAAYYVLKEPAAEKEIIRVLREQLPAYLIPRYWLELKSFPMIGPNKVDRNALPTLDAMEPKNLRDEYQPPRNEMENMLARLWGEVLGIQRIGVDDGFFEIGGHSLLLMQVQNNLEKELKISIEMADLFKYPTISLLASFLKDKHRHNDYLNQSKQRGELRRSLMGNRRKGEQNHE
ncbi:type I polyketide synthase [Paenibacillus sp. HW567]|uniref:type I polyketide synthase n=1 Tax=Paenibacillus sp. HW567 TaxID=1034769 RepID=UPI00037984F0|nr:type I polyketide synthase [Paenibacillus sp. HW567]